MMSKKNIFYILTFLIGFAVFIPVPFAPYIVHDRVSTFGVALPLVSLTLLSIFAIVLLAFHFRKGSISKYVVMEVIGIPVLFVALRMFLHEPLESVRYSATIWLNRDRAVSEFVNPFLGLQFMDCRGVSKSMDAVFVPEHIAPDTDYLEYSPQKDLAYDSGPIIEFYGDNWYQVRAGSQWYGSDLGNCALEYGLTH